MQTGICNHIVSQFADKHFNVNLCNRTTYVYSDFSRDSFHARDLKLELYLAELVDSFFFFLMTFLGVDVTKQCESLFASGRDV